MSNQQQNNYVAPQGQMSMAMTAPSDFQGKTKRTDIQLFPDGPQPGKIYAVVGLGTHSESFNNEAPKDRNKIFIGIEFPQLKQLFYEEDTEPRSTVMSVESVFSMGDRSKLRALAEAVIGRKFGSDEEARSFDVQQLVGATILVNVVTAVSKKSGKPYNKVGTVMSLGNYPLPPNFNPELPYQLFAIDPIGNNFKTVNYANLPFFLKKTILESNEAKDYIAKGGLFAKNPENNAQNGSTPQQPQQQQYAQGNAPAPAPAPVAAAPVQQGPRLEMLVTDFTYEQYIAGQWTDQMLIDANKARMVYPTPPPAPTQMAPPPVAPAPAPAVAPAPVQQQFAQQPQQVQQPAQQFAQQQFAQQPIQQPAQQQFAQPAQEPVQTQVQAAAHWTDEDDDDLPF